MNLTFGDYLIIEIALVAYMKDLDLTMQSGQYISELLGKLEYEMAQMRQPAPIITDPNARDNDTIPIPGN